MKVPAERSDAYVCISSSEIMNEDYNFIMLFQVLPAQTVSIIYQLGPHYVGTLQAALPPGQNQEPHPPLVAEEKVVFGINARAMSQLTLAKIRKVYSKNDNKAIAKQLGMSSHENATPIRILHNSAGHLMGPARCLGGTVVGYLGVRVFCPKPASIMVRFDLLTLIKS